MSQSTGNFAPPFNFVINEPSFTSGYDTTVPQVYIDDYESWMSQEPRESQPHQMPSPSMSVRTIVTLAESTMCSGPQYPQASHSPVVDSVDPNLRDLSLLAPPMQPTRSGFDSIAWHLQDQPWSAGNLRGFYAVGGQSTSPNTNMQYSAYRDAPASDRDGSLLQSDSGYHSHPYRPPSVLSTEHIKPAQELPSSIVQEIGSLNVKPALNGTSASTPAQFDQISLISSRSAKSAFPCSECGRVSKCKSDFNKHMLKHSKPFKCDVLNCKRAGKGFTTVNDLDRHKKSVHQIGLELKSYQCASRGCRNKDKIWPRLDNFKQHIERMHKGENEEDLIERSVLRLSRQQPTSFRCASVKCRKSSKSWACLDQFRQHISRTHADESEQDLITRSELPMNSSSSKEQAMATPMDTSFAVTGMEMSFPGTSALDDSHAIDLSLDQDSRRWSLFSHDSDLSKLASHGMQDSLSSPSVNEANVPLQSIQRQSAPYCRASSIVEQQLTPIRPPGKTTGQSRSAALGKNLQRPRLSSSDTPQTKTEQQTCALQRVSRAAVGGMRPPSSVEYKDLEDIVLRVLRKALGSKTAGSASTTPSVCNSELPSRGCSITINKIDALAALQAVFSHIEGSADSRFTMQRRSNQGLGTNAKICPKCGYAVARECDLRKHLKRHDKPYGCTYPRCHKRFGAKSDWKRHENSQHFQTEAFRCALPRNSLTNATCGLHYPREDMFAQHLREHHGLSESQVQCQVNTCRIGKNCQGQFWCGFCKEVKVLKQMRNAAWAERFDHIADHFEKGKKIIEEWLCAEENRSKKELLREMDQFALDDEEAQSAGPTGGKGMESSLPLFDVPSEQPQPQDLSMLLPEPQTTNKRKRPAGGSVVSAKREKIVAWTCCHCSQGPWLRAHSVSCTLCSHEICQACDERVTIVRDVDRDFGYPQ